jgi:signal transduction histidine kinase
MKIIYFLSFLWFTTFSHAINGTNAIGVHSKYVIDSTSSWKKTDLLHKSFIPFLSNTNLNIGYNKNTTVWCLFTFKNKTPQYQNTTWLVINNNHIDSLVFYDQNTIQVLGDRTKFPSRFLEGQCFKINLKPNEEKQVIVKLKKGISFFEFSYYLEKEEVLEFNSMRKITFISIFFGAVLLLVLFNSILYFITKNKLYLLYILYSVLTTLYISISTSYLKNYIFTDFLYFSELRIYISCFWFVSLSLFITYFLDLKTNQPKKYRIIYGCNILIVSAIITTLFLLYIDFLQPIQSFFIVTYISFIIIFILLAASAVVHIKIDKKNGVYIILAFLPQFVWGTYFVLISFGFISNTYHYDWVVFISLYEVLLFGYVLTKNYMETFLKNNDLILEIIAEKEKSIRLITQVQIRERRNIANVIHDNLGSKIAYVLQLLQLKNIALANTNIQELATDIREISHRILPKSLDDGALLDSLKSQIYILNTGLQHVKMELFAYDFPENINEIWVYDMYLISLEIVNNAIKHGKSDHITIEFYNYSDNYQFQFTDDGVGFNAYETPKGFGLENIEKRIHNYKGIFEINSVENQGTIIQISIPKKK